MYNINTIGYWWKANTWLDLVSFNLLDKLFTLVRSVRPVHYVGDPTHDNNFATIDPTHDNNFATNDKQLLTLTDFPILSIKSETPFPAILQ